MTLPASGSISTSQINTELGKSSTASITFNDAAVRKLAYKTTAGSAVVLPTDFYSKSFIYDPISLAVTNINESDSGELSYVSITYAFYSNGYIQCGYQTSQSGGFIESANGLWTQLVNNVGTNYWIRFTRTSFSGSGNYAATASTGWLQLNSTRSFNIFCAEQTSGINYIDALVTAAYTIQIASDSSGTNIISTTTNVGGTGSTTGPLI